MNSAGFRTELAVGLGILQLNPFGSCLDFGLVLLSDLVSCFSTWLAVAPVALFLNFFSRLFFFLLTYLALYFCRGEFLFEMAAGKIGD